MRSRFSSLMIHSVQFSNSNDTLRMNLFALTCQALFSHLLTHTSGVLTNSLRFRCALVVTSGTGTEARQRERRAGRGAMGGRVESKQVWPYPERGPSWLSRERRKFSKNKIKNNSQATGVLLRSGHCEPSGSGRKRFEMEPLTV